MEMRLTMMRHPEKLPGPESEAATAGTGLYSITRKPNLRLSIVGGTGTSVASLRPSLVDDDGSTHRSVSSSRRFKYYVTRERERDRASRRDPKILPHSPRRSRNWGSLRNRYSTRMHLRRSNNYLLSIS